MTVAELGAETAGEDPVTLGLEPVVEHVDRSLLARGGEVALVVDHGNQVLHLKITSCGWGTPRVGSLSPQLRTPLS